MEILILELADAKPQNESELISTVIAECYAKIAAGKVLRGDAFTAYTEDGDKYKIQLVFYRKSLQKLEVSKTPMLIPNFVFPFRLTAPDFKKFFRCREDMIKFLMERGDGIEYELTTTSESMLNNKGVLTPFNIKYTATDNTLIVDGKKYQLTFYDDFEGEELDKSKWDHCPEYERSDYGGKWQDDMAVLDGTGNLLIKVDTRNGVPVSGAVRTRSKRERDLFAQAQGYFEIKCKLQSATGCWGAFWLMCNGVSSVGNKATDGAEIDIFDVESDVDRIFLCSDGLTNMLDKEQIEKVLLGEGAIEDKVVKLIKKANNRGGTDNISVAYLIRNEEGEDK